MPGQCFPSPLCLHMTTLYCPQLWFFFVIDDPNPYDLAAVKGMLLACQFGLLTCFQIRGLLEISSQNSFPLVISSLVSLLKTLFKYRQYKHNKWKERFISLMAQSFLNNIIIDWPIGCQKGKSILLEVFAWPQILVLTQQRQADVINYLKTNFNHQPEMSSN